MKGMSYSEVLDTISEPKETDSELYNQYALVLEILRQTDKQMVWQRAEGEKP